MFWQFFMIVIMQVRDIDVQMQNWAPLLFNSEYRGISEVSGPLIYLILYGGHAGVKPSVDYNTTIKKTTSPFTLTELLMFLFHNSQQQHLHCLQSVYTVMIFKLRLLLYPFLIFHPKLKRLSIYWTWLINWVPD